MQIEIFEDRKDLPLDERTWNGLLAAGDVDTVFQSYQWFDAWWRTTGLAHQLFFLLLTDADGIVGFAPLAIMRGAGSLRELQFAAAAHADYLDFVITRRHEEALGEIARVLRRHRHRWNRVWLRNLPTHGRSFARLLPVFEAAGFYPVIESTIGCPTLLIRGYERQVRELVNKYSLRRRVNGLARAGRLSFHAGCAAEEIDIYLPMFFEQHVVRRSATASPSLFIDMQQRRFYTELAHALQQRGWLLFSRLELDGRPIAFHFGLRYRERLLWYKPSFDPDLAHLSPGLALIRFLIQHALEENLVELDFTIGDEEFKERFTNRRRANANVRVFNGPGAYCAAIIGRQIRRIVRKGRDLLWRRPSRSGGARFRAGGKEHASTESDA